MKSGNIFSFTGQKSVAEGFCAANTHFSIPESVHYEILPNGLELIIKEDSSAPVVSAHAWCRAGSINEGKWLGAGLSHVLEHMLFKGTIHRTGSQIDHEVQDAGGYMNAYTSFDRTVYYINVPNTGWSVAIDILCDIMQHASLPEEDLAKEMDVIRREMDMCHDDPDRRSSRRLFETAYTRSPYRHTVIGYPDIFNELTREDIFNYYRSKYAPNNLFMVIVGDFQTVKVVEQISRAFADTPARPLPSEALMQEPRQTAARMVVEEAPVEIGHTHFGWHLPGVRHSDIPALDVLACLLGSGRSSRLYREVRDRRALVHSADSWTYSPGLTGMFGMSAQLDPGKFESASDAMLAELDRLKVEPISREELDKASKQFLSGHLASQRTMQGQANDLGNCWLLANDLNFSGRHLEAVKTLTTESLKQAARTHLRPENRTHYALLPNGAAPRAKAVAPIKKTEPTTLDELSNGLRLLTKQEHRLPFVEFRLALRGGVLAEDTGNNGITHLMGRMLVKGTRTRSAEQIAEEIESVGGHLDAYGGNNSFGISAMVMRDDFETGLDLLSETLLHPAFGNAELERECEIQLAAIKSQRDQLLPCALKQARRELFGKTGYGLDALGEPESVAGINAEQLCKFHSQLTAPGNAVLAVYGDIDPVQTRERVEKVFETWQTPSPPLSLPEGAFPDEPRQAIQIRDKKQAVVVVGFPGTTLLANDRFALELVHEACSDLGSRLFLKIREELGLAYYVGTQNFMGLTPGCFCFYAGTAPEKASQVEVELIQQAELIRTQGLTEEEFKRAKAKVVGQKKIARQELGSLAMANVLDELYGLGYANSEEEEEHFQAVTLDQVRQAVENYLCPDSLVSVTFRPDET